MRNLAVLILVVILCGCKPENLHPVDVKDWAIFNFSVCPQDKVLDVGDTLTIRAHLGADFSPGFVIEDGVSQLPFSPWWYDSTLVVTQEGIGDFAVDSVHFDLLPLKGSCSYNSGVPGLIRFLVADQAGSTFEYEYKFVFKKKGVYMIGFQNGYLKGSNGTAYVTGYFDVLDHHYSFLDNEVDTPIMGTEGYQQNYMVGVQ